jgi:hypothetical protein
MAVLPSMVMLDSSVAANISPLRRFIEGTWPFHSLTELLPDGLARLAPAASALLARRR